jgi:hypothetical protein
MGDGIPTKAVSGICLSIIKKWIARTTIHKRKISFDVAGGAGLNSTNMARVRLATEAQEKNCPAGRPF